MVMQALFSIDMGGVFVEEKLKDYCRCFPPGKRFEAFFDRLASGVLENKERIDDLIERYSSNWKIRRMACVDRNVLRLAVYELLWCEDIPAKVTINEAIDIGKKFGTSESGAFINGILDSIRTALEKGELKSLGTEVSGQPAIDPEHLAT
jgi:transcription antitermination protein NusB